MDTTMTGRSRRGVATLAGTLLLAAGCADEPTMPSTIEQGPDNAVPTFQALLSCAVDVAEGSMACDPSAAPGTEAGARRNLIVGSQHQFVRMANTTPTVVGDVWSADVTVQNLTLQPFATADRSNAHANGVRVFFVDEPSNGVVISNHTGTDVFRGSDPAKYYEYGGTDLGDDGTDGILSPGEVSRAKTWEFTLNGATDFRFSVLVSTVIPDPAAYSVHLTRVVAGDYHTCGDGNDGKAYCWGGNYHGQLGNGTDNYSTTPVAVSAPPGVTFSGLGAGGDHACAEGSDGKVYCWGDNYYGQLGDGTRTKSLTPVPVEMPAGVTKISGLAVGETHTCGEGNDGKAYCWGYNGDGELGDGTKNISTTPVAVKLPAGVTKLSALAAGAYHTCAEGNDGKAYCWGNNADGQLGNGSTAQSLAPVPVSAPAGVTLSGLSVGGWHTCAEGDNGKAYCWGGNWYGQLGNGTDDDSTTPVAVMLPAGVTKLSGFAAGKDHSCAAGNDGKVYCWGDNWSGALGDGSTTQQLAPVAAMLPAGVTKLSGPAVGYYFSCATGNDGKTYCWGDNGWGQLGDGSEDRRHTPVIVAGTRGP